METTTAATTTNHLHDLGVTISGGDLTPDQLATLRRMLETEAQAMVERMNVALGGTKVGWYVSYDGSRECGEHR